MAEDIIVIYSRIPDYIIVPYNALQTVLLAISSILRAMGSVKNAQLATGTILLTKLSVWNALEEDQHRTVEQYLRIFVVSNIFISLKALSLNIFYKIYLRHLQ